MINSIVIFLEQKTQIPYSDTSAVGYANKNKPKKITDYDQTQKQSVNTYKQAVSRMSNDTKKLANKKNLVV